MNTRNSRVAVRITQKEIDTAVKGNSSHCMLADAIKRSLGGKNVSVDLQTIRWSDPKKRERYIFLTPPQAQRAILQFDEGIAPKPFRLKLHGGQIIPMKEWSNDDKKRVKRTQSRPVIVPNPDGHATTILGGKPTRMTHIGRRRTFGLREIRSLKAPL
jgi:hypothetical protein